MLHLPVTKYFSNQGSEKGFTLIEMIAVFSLISVMAAIASPGMIGFLARSKVTSAHSDLQGLLQEAQNSANRTSRDCSITLPATDSNNQLIASASCVTTGPRTLEDVQIRHNLAEVNDEYDGTSVLTANLFDFRGATDSFIDDHLVIVISPKDNDTFQKCIVVSNGLGLIRVGNYPSNEVDLDFTKCVPKQ